MGSRGQIDERGNWLGPSPELDHELHSRLYHKRYSTLNGPSNQSKKCIKISILDPSENTSVYGRYRKLCIVNASAYIIKIINQNKFSFNQKRKHRTGGPNLNRLNLTLSLNLTKSGLNWFMFKKIRPAQVHAESDRPVIVRPVAMLY